MAGRRPERQLGAIPVLTEARPRRARAQDVRERKMRRMRRRLIEAVRWGHRGLSPPQALVEALAADANALGAPAHLHEGEAWGALRAWLDDAIDAHNRDRRGRVGQMEGTGADH